MPDLYHPFRAPTGRRSRSRQAAIGLVAAQLFGNALYGEAVFRGFLFRQLLARARLRGGRRTVIAATAAAAIIFALSHIPVRVHEGYRGLDLVATLVVVALGGSLTLRCDHWIGEQRSDEEWTMREPCSFGGIRLTSKSAAT